MLFLHTAFLKSRSFLFIFWFSTLECNVPEGNIVYK